MMTRRLLLPILLLLMPAAALAQPAVAVTIRPLQFIAAAILDGVAEPVPVMRANANPHYYAMRPSERQALDNADLLLWVGPSLEGFMADVSAELDAELITAESLADLHQLLLGRNLDPHIWLDLLNVELLAGTLAQSLSVMDPANADQYSRNLTRFRAALRDTDQAIRKRLEGLNRNAPYAVYHNAFQYFEAQFGLAHRVSFTENDEFNPGVKRLLEIKQVMDADAVDCIVVEPGTNIQRLDAVMGNIGVRYVTVDVLGSDIAVTPESYFNLIHSVSEGLLTCLE